LNVRIVRPRTLLYAAVIAIVGSIMLYALVTRSPIEISVLHDRNPVYVRLSEGGIRNAYTLRLLNKELQPKRFHVHVSGLPGAQLDIAGAKIDEQGKIFIDVGADQSRELRALITMKRDELTPGRHDIRIVASNPETGRAAMAKNLFIVPEK
jgi:polyferredoxin